MLSFVAISRRGDKFGMGLGGSPGFALLRCAQSGRKDNRSTRAIAAWVEHRAPLVSFMLPIKIFDAKAGVLNCRGGFLHLPF